MIIYSFYRKKRDQIHFLRFIQLCLEEKLMEPNIFKSDNSPLISVILPSFNKEKVLMKSVRSIQNQSLKNIEIIIVDDCSSDDSNRIYKHLLEKLHKGLKEIYYNKNILQIYCIICKVMIKYCL